MNVKTITMMKRKQENINYKGIKFHINPSDLTMEGGISSLGNVSNIDCFMDRILWSALL